MQERLSYFLEFKLPSKNKRKEYLEFMLNNHYKDKGIDYDFSIDEVVQVTE